MRSAYIAPAASVACRWHVSNPDLPVCAVGSIASIGFVDMRIFELLGRRAGAGIRNSKAVLLDSSQERRYVLEGGVPMTDGQLCRPMVNNDDECNDVARACSELWRVENACGVR